MSKLTIWQGAALLYLDFAAKRDAEKGGAGVRTTRDVAEGIGVNVRQARLVLDALADADLVDVFDEPAVEWRITEAGVAAIAQEGQS